MTLPKDKKLKHEHIESMKLAVEHQIFGGFIQIKWKNLLSILFKRQGQKNKCHKGGCDPSFFVPY